MGRISRLTLETPASCDSRLILAGVRSTTSSFQVSRFPSRLHLLCWLPLVCCSKGVSQCFEFSGYGQVSDLWSASRTMRILSGPEAQLCMPYLWLAPNEWCLRALP